MAKKDKQKKQKKQTKQKQNLPKLEEIELTDVKEELEREKYKSRYKKVLKNTVSALITVAAVAVLISTLWLPVLRIYGNSMNPTLKAKQVVVSIKGAPYKQGDLVAFYYNNKLLIKRVIGLPGDWIVIEKDGTVFVNDKKLNEPYVMDKALGDCNLKFPYQVPAERLFVMGDHRSSSVDSRNSILGCVADEQIVGVLKLRIWPIEDFGVIRK